jgi:hypothetical protein
MNEPIFPSIRVWYTINAVSSLECDDLIEKIKSLLKNQEYAVVAKLTGCIEFENIVGSKSRIDIFRKLDGGVFTLTQAEEQCTITLKYYVPYTFEIFIFICLSLVGWFNGFIILLVAVPFILQLAIRISTLKRTALKLLNGISVEQKPRVV